jgi:hypothetical protein
MMTGWASFATHVTLSTAVGDVLDATVSGAQALGPVSQ